MKSKIIMGFLISFFMSSVAYADCPKAEDIKVRCPKEKTSCVFYAKGGWRQAQLWSEYGDGYSDSDEAKVLVSKIKQEVADKKLIFFLAKAKSGESGMQIDGCKYIVNWNGPKDGPQPTIDAVYLQLVKAKNRDVELIDNDRWVKKTKKQERDCSSKNGEVKDCAFTLIQEAN